jgi:hypothetical protein
LAGACLTKTPVAFASSRPHVKKQDIPKAIVMPEPGYLFLIGAPKCGTSSLSIWLKRQPGVVLSRPKEPCHFTDFGAHRWTGPGTQNFHQRWLTEWDAYDALFPHEGEVRWRVDASTDYLWNEPAADRIAAFARHHEVRVAVILRDPVERAISEHQHLLRDGYTKESLADALAAEEDRKAQRMHPLFYHVTRSRYHDAVARYRERFGGDLLVLDYHELKADQDAVLERLAGLLGLEVRPDVQLETRNAGTVYRSSLLRGLIRSRRNTRLARAIVPRKLRASIRGAVQDAATYRYRAAPDEIAELLRRLDDDIAACRADPFIPTANWSLALAAAPQAED